MVVGWRLAGKAVCADDWEISNQLWLKLRLNCLTLEGENLDTVSE